MRIATYNLYEGAQNTAELLETFVAEQQLDVLSLQEVNGWQDGSPSRLDEFAHHTNLRQYVYGDSNTRFKLAVFSKVPILSSSVYTEGFHHSAVRITVQDGETELDVWNIHLSPVNEDKRVAEAQQIISHIDMSRRVLINGDFNSLSAGDGYSNALIETIARLGLTKFGIDTLRFDVTRLFEQAGFVDLATRAGQPETTVPSAANTDPAHVANLRLDYMFATPWFAQAVQRLSVSKDALTDRISDHYPVVLTTY